MKRSSQQPKDAQENGSKEKMRDRDQNMLFCSTVPNKRRCNTVRNFLALTVLFVFISSGGWAQTESPQMPKPANNPKTAVRIGVLANRGKEICLTEWAATAAYLGEHIGSRHFEIVPLGFEEVNPAVEYRQVDFIITNSSMYVALETKGLAYRIATFQPPPVNAEPPLPLFGGVIFWLNDRKDIHALSDFKGKRFGAVEPSSLGGWQAAWRELQRFGIHPQKDFSRIVFYGTHDAVVVAVAQGEVDGGTVRSSQLERMAMEGLIDLRKFRVLPPPEAVQGYPYRVSTRLYPEWPFAVVTGTDLMLGKSVASAMLQMSADDPAAKASGSAGWTIPQDYGSVNECIRELRLPPYENFGRISMAEVVREYWAVLLAAGVGILLALTLSTLVLRKDRRLKYSMEALRESEQKFHLTFSASPDAVNINRLRDGLYIDINEGFTRATGFTQEDIRGRTSLEINVWNNPADRDKLIQGLRENGFYENLEARFRKKDGGLITGLMSARIISLQGEPHIISITRDISERKLAELDHQRLTLAIEQSDEMVLITDTRGVILYVNPAFEEMTGYSKQEAVGSHNRMLRSDQHDRSFYESIRDEILFGRLWKGRTNIKRKDGISFTAESSISPVKGERGDIINFVCIARDITRDLALEQRFAHSQRIEAIGALAGGIAHDFNNILFPIIGISEMLKNDLPADSPDHENVSMIYQAGVRAAALVKQILSFSRQADLKKIPLRMQKILLEVVKLSRSTIPSNIEITHDIQKECGLVLADPTQLHQVAMNLVTNAYHAVEQAGGKISISLKEMAVTDEELSDTSLEAGKYALLCISDTGPGIDPAHIGKIFEPYFTTKGPGKGTGLGLSVVYGIVKEYHGDIKVISSPGQGATFKIYFPILEDSGASENASKTALHPTGTERILLVDDEIAIARIVQLMLERLGYRVTVRTSSIDALEEFLAAPKRYDLVITDMAMPNMTGEQLIRKILSRNPDQPVILCTGYSENIDDRKAKIIGMKGLLMKPVSLKELAVMVRKALDG
jgi:PAS domain S-box-containing protein